ncbi:MAG: NADH-quinone oxidoreductase subunit NuoG [Actinomycetota bacterium]|nr:NADH-quinone oxidoreductase subunit NuoG [Actinomycetota bacterium]
MTEERATVTINLDGVDVQVESGQTLIDAAQMAGTYIPRFCYHPRMKAVGLCRACLVEVEGPRGTALVPSCTTPVGDGMIVHTQSETARKAQEGVLEFLLINHPLDCPVCDKGGECPLQDQAFAFGAGETRFVEEKRHYEKPIEISDLILLDRERCILCARCTRFSDEISGDPLIEFKDRGNYVQVITFPDEPFASYFSGNTVQICPVGALTAKPYRFKARPWDIEGVESVSLVDTVHSKISVQTSHNEIIRIYGIDNDATNHGWLSDKDRFVFDHVQSEDRLTTPLVKEDGEFREATWAEAITLVTERLGSFDGDKVAGIGGARSTNEDAYAFSKFLRSVVGTTHLDAQIGDGLDPVFAATATPRAEINDLETAKTILLWGPDLKEELPVLYLRVRRAVTELGANLVIVHPRRTGLDDVATHTIRYKPGTGPDLLRKFAAGDGEYASAREALGEGPVLALVGRTGLAEDPDLAEAVAAFALDLPDAKIMPLMRRGNVFGALDMGVAPTLLPGRVAIDDEAGRSALEEHWGPLPQGTGLDTTGILEALASGELGALVLNGADPVRDYPTPSVAVAALDAAEFVVSFEMFMSDSAAYADVILPVVGLGEVEGTATNLEGRIQKVNRIVPSAGMSRPVWSIIDDLATAMGAEFGATSVEAVGAEITRVAPAYAGVSWDRLTWGDDSEGLVLPGPEGTQPLKHTPVDRGVPVVSGHRVIHTARVLYDDGVMVRNSSGISGLAAAGAAHLHPRDASVLAVTEGDEIVVTVDGEVRLPVVIDPSLVEGTVYVPFNLASTAGLGAVGPLLIDAVRGGDA